jgi:predicted metal-dependent hydrolase
VQVTKSIPKIEEPALTEAVQNFIEDALKHSQVGFGMEIRINED